MTKLNRGLDNLLVHSKRSRQELVTTAAKGFVRDVVAITPPAGKGVKGTAAKKLGEAAILGDLRRIFSPQSPEAIEALRAFQGERHLETFGHQGAAALGTVETRILSRGDMDAWHHDRRTAGGRVKNVHRDVTTGLRKRDLSGLDTGVVTSADFNWFLKARQKLVGKLAAGWNAAAAKLGVALPSWVTRHGGSEGSVQVVVTAFSFRLILTNAVSFVGNVRGYERRVQSAINKQGAKMQRQADVLLARAQKKSGL